MNTAVFLLMALMEPEAVMNTSYYAERFHGRTMANGEPFDMNAYTAAHKELPFGTILWLRNPQNGRLARVEITDKGPFIAGRHLDVSKAVATQLDFIEQGVTKLEIISIKPPS